MAVDTMAVVIMMSVWYIEMSRWIIVMSKRLIVMSIAAAVTA